LKPSVMSAITFAGRLLINGGTSSAEHKWAPLVAVCQHVSRFADWWNKDRKNIRLLVMLYRVD